MFFKEGHSMFKCSGHVYFEHSIFVNEANHEHLMPTNNTYPTVLKTSSSALELLNSSNMDTMNINCMCLYIWPECSQNGLRKSMDHNRLGSDQLATLRSVLRGRLAILSHAEPSRRDPCSERPQQVLRLPATRAQRGQTLQVHRQMGTRG